MIKCKVVCNFFNKRLCCCECTHSKTCPIRCNYYQKVEGGSIDCDIDCGCIIELVQKESDLE